jgi:hypothetical protein
MKAPLTNKRLIAIQLIAILVASMHLAARMAIS